MNGTWIVSVSLKCQIEDFKPCFIQPTHCMHAHLVLNLIIMKKEYYKSIRGDLTYLNVLS